ncbi:hypothetical protein LX36DRAFT_658436 [Colletotrichum falcatum]|nr:hypothetical protein LX36DRAFT_658436 [Colletotrichum falcatum]
MPDQAPGQAAPGPYGYDPRVEEAFRELLDKLIRWEITTPEDVQVMREEIDKIAVARGAPAAPPPSGAGEKWSSELGGVGDEVRPGAGGADGPGGDEGSVSGPRWTGLSGDAEEAERMAFDVVDAEDARDPGDEYVLYDVKSFPARAGGGGARARRVSCGEGPADVDGDYVLV